MCEELIVRCIERIQKSLRNESERSRCLNHCTGPQLSMLRAMREEPLPTPTRLAMRLHVSQSTASQILSGLTKLGAVSSHPLPDRRFRIYRLTPQGKSMVAVKAGMLPKKFRLLFAELNDWEREMVCSGMQKLADLMTL